jgi:hypothetical protein
MLFILNADINSPAERARVEGARALAIARVARDGTVRLAPGLRQDPSAKWSDGTEAKCDDCGRPITIEATYSVVYPIGLKPDWP